MRIKLSHVFTEPGPQMRRIIALSLCNAQGFMSLHEGIRATPLLVREHVCL